MKRTNPFAILFVALLSISSTGRVWGDTFGTGANSFDIAFVTIGNPGNPADTTGSPRLPGSVPYIYRIGTYEISRDMITKANNLGSLAITLFDMSPYGGNGANRPATGLSWNAAARFVNWLNTSTGSPPAYKFAVQPGGSGYSPNTNIQLWTSSDAGFNSFNVYRNSLARYFLPSDNEWYKAAYYDPSGSWYDYPTRSDSAPTPVTSSTTAATAVYNQLTNQGPADITLAGGPSPYGTIGQGGNANEWEETDYDLVNGPNSSTDLRSFRGGYWASGSSNLSSSDRGNSGPASAGLDLGFRVASTFVPEP